MGRPLTFHDASSGSNPQTTSISDLRVKSNCTLTPCAVGSTPQADLYLESICEELKLSAIPDHFGPKNYLEHLRNLVLADGSP